MKPVTFLYLSKTVSPRMAAWKKRNGVCKHWGCTKPARKNRSDCYVCKDRKNRAAQPARHSYRNIKKGAKRRGIPFTLTFVEFLEFDRLTNYVELSGQSPDALSIDRIESSKGYEAGNIRALTWIENCRRRVEGMTEPVEPIAQALAKAYGHNIWQRCLQEAVTVLEMVRVLKEQKQLNPDDGVDPFEEEGTY
jgi:hypothetical protein